MATETKQKLFNFRSQVAQLLSEIPQNKTPLFRFTELFKSRFLNSVSVSELNKMKDVCVITEEDGGRMIAANTRSQISSYPNQVSLSFF